ncbi:hypothetical protein [Rhizobium grahamii]|uniref:Beta-lactamase n=1 Tax=Rhizobium grahamii CCGE 502 TaxID=990285 RepID=S3IEH9_9HYPH|nr:hypothetical protein [Rhizobium grahamii]EPE97473.1 beta-lactamase [Rhizobium grahamii CCGE 502]
MLTMSRRAVLGSAAAAAAFGLSSKLEFVLPALGATPLEPAVGLYKYKVGDVEVTAIYDGIWKKPHDPKFIKNASIDDTRQELSNAGLTTEFMPIPLTVVVLKLGDHLVMMDAGSGVGQWQSNATHLPANMAAAGIDKQLLVSADIMYVPALLAPHPEWQGSYDQDGPMAIDTRRRLIDRVIADDIAICGSHFPFPGSGTFVKDGSAYGFTPTIHA